MRLTTINCIILASATFVLASQSESERPKRHLHQIKEMIANKIFGSSATNSSQNPPDQPEVKFFKIPGFDSVVIKAVPKGSEIEPPPIIEKIPPNSRIGIIGSYLGTDNLNDTYSALLGVKNLLKSGILDGNQAALDVALLPSKAQYIVSKPLKPCAKAEFVSAPAVEPIRVMVKPPMVPDVVPTQYSYKQVNQDGSLTSYTSALDISKGLKVTEKGKTLPFFIDRLQKIPVQLPVPVLPEVSKIIFSNPLDVGFGPSPVEVVHPGFSYSYKQVNHGGKLTTYSDLPLFNSKNNGAVVVTETNKRIPPPQRFLMDRIEKVAATASYPKVPFIDFIQPMPMAIDVPAGHVMYSAPVLGRPVAVPTGEYAYTQKYGNGGQTYSASGAFGGFVDNPAVLVTEHKLPLPLNPFPRPDMKAHKPPASGSFSYNQVNSNGKGTQYTGADVSEYGLGFVAPEPVVLGVLPVPEFQGIPPGPNSFSYKQVGDGKVMTYTGHGVAQENPAVIVKSNRHPVPPPHLTERIEMVAAGARFNRPPILSTPMVSPFAFSVPASFVEVPSVQPSVPQRPVKIPSASSTSPFLYKHIHSDGSITNFGGDTSNYNGGQAPVPLPNPHSSQRVFESPMYTGPFPVGVNPNAVKPSSPVSGSYSYKLANNDRKDMEHSSGHQLNVPSGVTRCIEPCPVPPVGPSSVIFDEPVPLSYTYKQISHSQPDPFLAVNVEDPVMGAKKVNIDLSQNSQGYVPDAYPAFNMDQNPNGVFVPPPMDNTHIPRAPEVQSAATPQSSFSYKQVNNQGIYEYSDEFNSGVKTNQPSMMTEPQVKPADNVYVEKPPVTPVMNNRDSLADNPIVVPEPASFSFKQSNSNGSSITTVMDNSQNGLSVKVEEAAKPESTQLHESPKVISGFEQVSEAPSPVSHQMTEASSTESAPPKKKLRRRVLKRVKNRGDIPDTE